MNTTPQNLEGSSRAEATNRQIVFPAPRAVELVDCDFPTPGDGEVLVETERTLISTGTELATLAGEAAPGSAWDRYFPFPHTPGYTNLGVVIACGAGVDQSLIGQRVVNHGPHARYVTTPTSGLRLAPPDLPADYAIFFNLAEITMNGVRRAGIRWGDSVAVFGAGILGQLTAQFCLVAGARRVFVADVSEYRLSLLPQHPRLVPVNSRDVDLESTVREHNSGRLVDIVYELTGNSSLIPSEFAVLREQGTMAIVSSPVGSTWFDFHDLCNRQSFKIVGIHNHSHPVSETPDNPWTNQRDCEYFFDMCRDGDLDMARMVSATVKPEDAPGVYGKLLEDRGRFMGVVIDWSGGANTSPRSR